MIQFIKVYDHVSEDHVLVNVMAIKLIKPREDIGQGYQKVVFTANHTILVDQQNFDMIWEAYIQIWKRQHNTNLDFIANR